jgi:nitrogen fixation protein NifU and related proteins
MTAYGSTVLEHYRRPRNHLPMPDATARADGSNPLCGDRIRMEIRVEDGVVRAAAFTANACAICTAAASLLTSRLGGQSVDAALALRDTEVVGWLDTNVPAARVQCATLPLRTLRAALGQPAT